MIRYPTGMIRYPYNYYVYEYWHLFDGCIYVGMGSGGRYATGNYSPEFNEFIRQMDKWGFKPEILIPFEGLPYRDALDAERIRIKYWSDIGHPLTNILHNKKKGA